MRRLIAAAVHNPVATNLLMVVLIVAGSLSAVRLKRETLPQLSFDIIQISVPFAGATPAEVEEGIVVKIEEALLGVEGIRRLFSHSYEGMGFVWAELEPGVNNRQVMEDIKTAVEQITTFPQEAETPRFVELVRRQQVINVAVYGAQPERVLKEVAARIRDDLLATPAISQVALYGTRDYEITIEVDEATLERYHLTFDQLRELVRRSSLDLPGGELKTPTQDIVVRTAGQRYTAAEFAALPILTRPDGTYLTLGDLARVRDGFEEAERLGRFSAVAAADASLPVKGQPAVLVMVFKTDEEDAIAIAETVRRYVAQQAPRLPPGLALSVWADTSQVIKDRLQLLTRNGLMGLVLVLLTLWLFMNLRLAFWVAAGLPVAFMGAFWLLEAHGDTLNMITLFACIMALGMLVDDAIVVGENVYTHWHRGKPPQQAAIDGASEVAWPVIAAVTTTVAAFVPLFLVEGILGKFIAVLPVAMIAALLTSLLESLVILPPHLAHSLPASARQSPWRWAFAVRQRLDAAVAWGIQRLYLPLLQRAMQWRLPVAAAALAVLLFMLGLVLGGHLNFYLFPKVDADTLLARLVLPPGTPLAQTLKAVERLEAAAWALNREFRARQGNEPVVQRVMSIVGTQSGYNPEVGSHAAEVTLELLPVEQRGIASATLIARWRELTGDIPEALALSFSTPDIGPGGAPIEVRLMSDHFADLRQAADRLKAELATYPGVFDIQDDLRPGKRELHLALTPAGRALGLTLADLARQVRQALYGAEALRVQRGRDEVRVVLRYPAAQRRALGDLERMRIRTPDGRQLPFGVVATVTAAQGYAVIKHDGRRRKVSVTADVDPTVANAEKILADLDRRFLPHLVANYEGMRYSFEGQHRETQRSLDSLYRGFALALVLIYAILATIFRSAVQPLIVMAAIPFGLTGAVLGHLLMGHDLTMMSLFGLVALSGIVVNDSLVLIDFINRARREGATPLQAVLAGGQARFRAIILTTLTTVAGLLPLLTEKSFQAQFLIPMAISISFGLMGATLLTLVLVPALYLLLEDLRRGWRWLVRKPVPPQVAVPAAEGRPRRAGVLHGEAERGPYTP
ncbi:MAG: multidrug transporter [Candidatus Tectimicrobiota bacterium]|nr:MAG: multidrug transporter [Candidatus Tectomicrobia bacterium]